MSLASGVRRFLQWYAAYYKVELPESMTPTRRERDELWGKYEIGSPSDGKRNGKHRDKRRRATRRV